MNLNTPKYSIIIPTYNGINYLPTCVETIISQSYADYELIISDDHSVDGTREYLEKINHPNIKVIYPPESLSMTEHWEWALSHAKGDWQIFVGQDDGLQNYFFQLADKLTNEANQKRVRTITSTRAYFFWQGCEHVYGDVAVGYDAENKTKIKSFTIETLKALFGLQTYFELPQMYTTSIFHKSILDQARTLQKGKVFSAHPQDANLAAIAYSLEKHYLKSFIPLGWVGSSPKSAGMAISGSMSSHSDKENNKSNDKLKKEYLNKVAKSKLRYHELAGDFAFGSIALYFWQALLMTQKLRPESINNKIQSRVFKTILFSSIMYTKKFPRNKKSNFPSHQFSRLLEINDCNKYIVTFLFIVITLFAKPFSFFLRALRKIMKMFTFDRVSRHVKWGESPEVRLETSSSDIGDKIRLRGWL